MRFKKRVPAHVEEKVVSTKTICDGCGAQIEPHLLNYTYNEVTIEAAIGDVYPESDNR